VRRIVVVGAGLAGLHAAQALRKAGFGGEVVVVGDEPDAPYDRPPLSKDVLAGTATAASCALASGGLDAGWRLGRRATALDAAARVVTLDGAEALPYDGLVIATGRRARSLPITVPAGCHTLRSLADARRLRAALAAAEGLVIVGAGFIGCEVASTARKLGLAVDVVDVAPHPMPVMGAVAARHAQALHEAHGVRFHLGAGVEGFDADGEGHVAAVRLAGGHRLPTGLVLVAVGSVPNTEWLAGSGLTLERGCVRCDEHCLADGADGVVAVGDVATWPHPGAGGLAALEHWTNARDMARAGAHNLLSGPGDRTPYAPVPTFWSEQHGVKLKSVGFLGQATSHAVVEDDPEHGRFVVEALHEDRLVGAVMFNRNRLYAGYQRRLQSAVTPAA
jgi:3-phenylpropionate/trans-cinnamate dioxygenase ferredoxin reductase subunit